MHVTLSVTNMLRASKPQRESEIFAGARLRATLRTEILHLSLSRQLQTEITSQHRSHGGRRYTSYLAHAQIHPQPSFGSQADGRVSRPALIPS